MLTKEKFLKDKISLHIKSPKSNKDYVKLIQKLIDLGWETYNNTSAENFAHYTWICLPYIDEEYFEIHPRDNPDGQKEIQISDILEENNQFEAGKWYSFYWNWGSGYDIVAKVAELGEVVMFDNFINIIQGSHLNQSFNSIRLTEIENIKELTLEKIQQYLPEGHVDKLPKKFVLPGKWCVKSTNDTIRVINDFIKSKGYKHSLVYNIYYIHYPFLNEKYSAYVSIQDGYTEITFEQFKQHVLKERVEEVKTIEKWSIGAKVTKPETKKPKEMQLSDLKNPVFNIGDKVRVIANSLKEFNSSWSNGNNARYKKGYEGIITSIDGCKSNFKEVTTWYYLDGDRNNAISCNLLELAEPVKKEFDRNWYVEVNNQEEADKVFDWLESQDENTFRDHACFNETFKYIRQWNNVSSEHHNKWFLSSEKKNKSQKQLSDIIPNYSLQPKVDRDVYHEVSNQEQHEEIISKVKKSIEF